MNEDVKGFLLALVAAVAAGGAFTQAIPVTGNDWWKFGWGLVIATATQFLMWKRQTSNDKDRKTVLSEADRNDLRTAQDAGSSMTAKDIVEKKEGGYARIFILVALSMVAGCAFFGAVQPKNAGQGLVHTYGTAVIVTQSIPGLLQNGAVKAGQARVAQDASKNTRVVIETYWDNAAILQPCLAAAVAQAPAPLCDGGPGAAQVAQVIAVDINVLTQFLTQYVNK